MKASLVSLPGARARMTALAPPQGTLAGPAAVRATLVAFPPLVGVLTTLAAPRGLLT